MCYRKKIYLFDKQPFFRTLWWQPAGRWNGQSGWLCPSLWLPGHVGQPNPAPGCAGVQEVNRSPIYSLKAEQNLRGTGRQKDKCRKGHIKLRIFSLLSRFHDCKTVLINTCASSRLVCPGTSWWTLISPSAWRPDCRLCDLLSFSQAVDT